MDSNSVDTFMSLMKKLPRRVVSRAAKFPHWANGRIQALPVRSTLTSMRQSVRDRQRNLHHDLETKGLFLRSGGLLDIL